MSMFNVLSANEAIGKRKGKLLQGVATALINYVYCFVMPHAKNLWTPNVLTLDSEQCQVAMSWLDSLCLICLS